MSENGRILLPMTARDLRRTVGEEAVAIIEHHSEVLLTQQQVLGRLVLQVESLTQQLNARTRSEPRTFVERLRWLVRGAR